MVSIFCSSLALSPAHEHCPFCIAAIAPRLSRINTIDKSKWLNSSKIVHKRMCVMCRSLSFPSKLWASYFSAVPVNLPVPCGCFWQSLCFPLHILCSSASRLVCCCLTLISVVYISAPMYMLRIWCRWLPFLSRFDSLTWFGLSSSTCICFVCKHLLPPIICSKSTSYDVVQYKAHVNKEFK